MSADELPVAAELTLPVVSAELPVVSFELLVPVAAHLNCWHFPSTQNRSDLPHWVPSGKFQPALQIDPPFDPA